MTNDTQSHTTTQVAPTNIEKIDEWCRNAWSLFRTKMVQQRSLAEAMQRTGKTPEELQLANLRRQLLRWRHILRIAAQVGSVSLRELAKLAKADWRTCKEALAHTLDEVSLQLREAFTKKRTFFALLSKPNAANAASKNFETAAHREQRDRGRAAKDNQDGAKRRPILLSTNPETGEVIMQDDLVLPPHKIPKSQERPITNASSPVQSREAFQEMKKNARPMPPEVREQFKRILARYAKKPDAPDRAKAPAPEWVPANEEWFRDHAEEIDRVMARRSRPPRPLGYS